MATVLVPLADGAEELEAVTVIDLLRRAGISVVVAGLKSGPVTCSRGTMIQPDATFDGALAHNFDMVVLPGGQPGATNLEHDPRVLKLLRDMAAKKKYTAAICAAPKVLAVAGVLDGKRATSFPGSLDAAKFPRVQVQELSVVADGHVITSRGPGTAMDFALELIRLLAGEETRNQVEAGLQRPVEHLRHHASHRG
jgi:4-methyl-5(b-hydroxyethyl)-thiazole monophosphate biosynthesis